jgi:hypothetical protein
LLALSPVVIACAPFLLGVPLGAGDPDGLLLAAAAMAFWTAFSLVELTFVLLFPMFGSIGQVMLGSTMAILMMGHLAVAVSAGELVPNSSVTRSIRMLAQFAFLWTVVALLVSIAVWLRLRRLRTGDVSLTAAVEN